jgi:hypothetical protein
MKKLMTTSVDAFVGTSVEFVCNVPGPIEEVVNLLSEISVTTIVRPRLFANVEKDWCRVGDNFVGPALGQDIDGAVGIYVLAEKLRVPALRTSGEQCNEKIIGTQN